MRKLAIVSMIGLLAAGAAATRAAADVQITDAKGTDLKVGEIVPDQRVFKVPAGGEIVLRTTGDNQSFTIRGPFEGTLGDFMKRCSGVWGRNFDPICRPAGGGDRLPVGGTRGTK